MARRATIYKEIIKQYDAMQMDAQHRLRRKREELYGQVPRIKEIEQSLNNLGVEIAKIVLREPSKALEAIETLKRKQEMLKREKIEVLIKNGYKEDVLDAQYACLKCKDTGFIDNIQCTCFSQKLVDAVYNKSNLKQIIKDENFENFKLNYYSPEVGEGEAFSPREVMQRNIPKCLEFVKNFGQKGESLLIYGQTGLGKTFMCNCIAKELLDKGVTVMYVTAPQLFGEMEKERFSFNQDNDEEKGQYLEDVLSVELLIIDDLGSEMDTAFTLTQLFNVINTRMINNMPTIISTNLDMKNLAVKYSERITSRLIGNFTTLKFIGKDIRALKKFV